MRNKWTKPFDFPSLQPGKFPDHRARTGNSGTTWKSLCVERQSLRRSKNVESQGKALKRRELHWVITLKVCRGYPRVSRWILISTCIWGSQEKNQLGRIRENRTQRSHRARNSSCSYQPEWKIFINHGHSLEYLERFCLSNGIKLASY